LGYVVSHRIPSINHIFSPNSDHIIIIHFWRNFENASSKIINERLVFSRWTEYSFNFLLTVDRHGTAASKNDGECDHNFRFFEKISVNVALPTLVKSKNHFVRQKTTFLRGRKNIFSYLKNWSVLKILNQQLRILDKNKTEWKL